MPWMAVAGGIAATVGAVGQGITGKNAAERQLGAAQDVSRRQQALFQQQIGTSQQRTAAGIEALRSGSAQGIESLGMGQLALNQGFGEAARTVGDAGAAGRVDISSGLGRGSNTLGGLMGLAGGQRSRVDELLDQGIESDPGFQFRLQQGEQALARKNAATGGRMSGAAMKELAQFSQGLASQEFQNAFGRASQADALTQSRTGQQLGIGSQLAGMQFAGGQSLANLGMNVAGQQAGFEAAKGQGIAGLFAQQAGMQNQLGQNILAANQFQTQQDAAMRAAQAQAMGLPLNLEGGGDAVFANIFGQIHRGGQEILGSGLGGAGAQGKMG